MTLLVSFLCRFGWGMAVAAGDVAAGEGVVSFPAGR